MRKVKEVVIKGDHLKIKDDCPDCPEDGHTAISPPDTTRDKLKEIIKEKYPGAKITEE